MYTIKYVNKQIPKEDENAYNNLGNIDFPKEYLAKLWEKFDWKKAEEQIFIWQKSLTKVAISKNLREIRKIQNKITTSIEGRMIAVKKVSENSNSSGIDGIKWRTDADKMKAAISLTCDKYEAMPLKNFVLKDKKSNRSRTVGIPTMYDRAMHTLYAMALDPVAEAWGDLKSFGFRKGRSAQIAHAHLLDALKDTEATNWILVADVHSYYGSISHEWLLKHIPMNRYVLKQFLKANIVLENGELFPIDEGISLGCSLSPILGNMVLDGLQSLFYKIQGEKISDYKNGWCLRFADDIVIMARTEKDAKKFQNLLINFLEERGLKLSFEKTKIINLNFGDSFDFLARTYYKKDGIIHSIPSRKSEAKFRENMEEFIFDPVKKWTPKKIVTEVNYKLNGWASYHRVSEAKEAFRRLDSFTWALVYKLIQKMYPNYTKEQIIKKYYWKASDGRYIFALASNRDYKIVNLVDVVLVNARKIDLKKNYFLDKEYFDELNDKVEIENVTGRYKKVWEIQNGRCAICNKKIQDYESRKIINKKLSKDTTIRNMLYIHTFCEYSEQVLVYGNFGNINTRNTIDIIKDIEDIENGIKTKQRPSKFDKLKAFFHECNKTKITLTFKNIEKIIGSSLCKSAYKHQSYFYNHSDERAIANSWVSQNYKISNFDMENQKITFSKNKTKKGKVVLPKYLFKDDIPSEAKYEIEDFFEKIKIKYKL
jgi:RNA-directed DNA polymerase